MKIYQRSALSHHFAITLVVVTLIGCGGAPQNPVVADAPATGTSTPEAIRALPQAQLPDGQIMILELALTHEEIAQGLMFRNSLPEDRGMLFLFSEERIPSFWMKNTLIPLDMVFLSPQGVIVDIVHDARPCTADPCPQYVPKAEALAVLEIAAGVAEKHSLQEGSHLVFERVPGFPAE
jgi:uncharacterized membrane protein (UPF0127 family)